MFLKNIFAPLSRGLFAQQSSEFNLKIIKAIKMNKLRDFECFFGKLIPRTYIYWSILGSEFYGDELLWLSVHPLRLWVLAFLFETFDVNVEIVVMNTNRFHSARTTCSKEAFNLWIFQSKNVNNFTRFFCVTKLYGNSTSSCSPEISFFKRHAVLLKNNCFRRYNFCREKQNFMFRLSRVKDKILVRKQVQSRCCT